MPRLAATFTRCSAAEAPLQPQQPTLCASAAQGGRDAGGTPLQLMHLIGTTAAALAAAAVVTQGALAGGEPKNEWPFTRSVEPRSTQAAKHADVSNPTIQGEPKNEPPFTRPVVVVASSRSGFSWRDGAIGGLGGVGITLAGAGALLATRRSPRPA